MSSSYKMFLFMQQWEQHLKRTQAATNFAVDDKKHRKKTMHSVVARVRDHNLWKDSLNFSSVYSEVNPQNICK